MRIEDDEKFMARALELAAKGLGRTRPNPMVGAVVVKDGEIIGEGWHRDFGGPHAEVNAFASCREDPKGATLYVTLEPCSHYGKTPPCADLVISKDVERVVIAMEDPNPIVSGRGIRKLKEAGIFVTTGVMEKEARLLNEAYVKFITERKPFVLYKAAMSADGKTACYTGESQWISSEESREDARAYRGMFSAVMVGAGTVAADNPRLTARTEGLKDPARIIVDGKLSVSTEAEVFTPNSRVIVLTCSDAPKEKVETLQKMNVDVIFADSDEPGVVDLDAAMTGLGLSGIDSVLLEGGAETAASAFEAGVVDKVRLYVAPMIIGGRTAPGVVGGTGAEGLSEAVKLKNIKTDRSGPDIVIEGYVVKKPKPRSVGEAAVPKNFKADLSEKKPESAKEEGTEPCSPES